MAAGNKLTRDESYRLMVMRASYAGLLFAAALATTACDRSTNGGTEVEGPQAPIPTQSAVSSPQSGTAGDEPELDVEALRDRTDPERLARYYANAIHAGMWTAAARAWTIDSDVTGKTLEAAYGGGALPRLTIGKGDIEGAAGSLFYEAPVVIEFPDGREARRGTITLRRVNDVPGASEEQLNWRIERSTLLPDS